MISNKFLEKHERVVWPTLTVAYASLIFYLSSIPLKTPIFLDVIDPYRLSLHFIEFFFFAILVSKTFGKFLPSFILSSSYGILDEVHQYFVPFRTFSLYDALADVLGCLVATLLIFKFLKTYHA